MSEAIWQSVDAYIEQSLLPSDPVLDAVLKANADAGLPAIDVSPSQGALLNIFARMCNAKRILEIGTLGGYSTIWMARALPADGRIITLEYEPRHAQVARANIARAGLADRAEVRVGRAIDLLPSLADEGTGPFDLVFIDADKPSNGAYLAWAMKLSRPGTVIVCDNVVRGGEVSDPNSRDGNVRGARDVFVFLGEAGVTASAVQTVGSKGYDGFAIAIVGENPTR